MKGDFEKHYSNIVEREATIGEDTFVISSEREVILPNTSRKIGHLEISKLFIEEENTIKFQLSTEDNVKFIEYKGKEIIK